MNFKTSQIDRERERERGTFKFLDLQTFDFANFLISKFPERTFKYSDFQTFDRIARLTNFSKNIKKFLNFWN